MEQYINKAAVKAELETRIEETKGMQPQFDQFWAGQISAFKGVLKILGTLEVNAFTSMSTITVNGVEVETKIDTPVSDSKTDWSPSKKQMESLKDMLKWNIGDFNYQEWVEVNSLYDDLTKIDTPVSDSRKANHAKFIKELKQKIDYYERELSKSGDSTKCDDIDWVTLASDMFDMLQKCLKNYTG